MATDPQDNGWQELRLKARILLQLGELLTAQEVRTLFKRNNEQMYVPGGRARPEVHKWLDNMSKVKGTQVTQDVNHWPATVDVETCQLFCVFHEDDGTEVEGWLGKGTWTIVGDVVLGRVPMVQVRREVRADDGKRFVTETRYVRPDLLKIALYGRFTTQPPVTETPAK